MKKTKPKHNGPYLKKIDPAQAASVAAMGGTNDQIAAALNISKGTLFNLRKRDPEFDAAIAAGKDRADIAVVQSLYKKATGGDTTAMIFWLKNRRPQEWRDRHEYDHSGKVDGDNKLTVEIVHTKSDDTAPAVKTKK